MASYIWYFAGYVGAGWLADLVVILAYGGVERLSSKELARLDARLGRVQRAYVAALSVLGLSMLAGWYGVNSQFALGWGVKIHVTGLAIGLGSLASAFIGWRFGLHPLSSRFTRQYITVTPRAWPSRLRLVLAAILVMVPATLLVLALR